MLLRISLLEESPDKVADWLVTRFILDSSTLTLGAAGPLVHLLLPRLLEQLGVEHVPAALVQLPPVVVGPGVRPPLVLGVHPDLGRVLASQRPAVTAVTCTIAECSDKPTYSGSRPSLIAFCLFCCLCLSFSSFNCDQ